MAFHVETYIIDILTKGSLPSTKIVENSKKKMGVTKEAVYKALRNLIKEEICVRRGMTISLSNQWVIDMAEKWRRAETRYISGTKKPILADKNSIVYTCKTLDQLDTLWNHNIYELVALLSTECELLSSVPHYWFPAIRGGSEHRLMQTLTSRGYTWLQLASNAQKLDVEFRKYFPYKEIQYHAVDIPEKNYINIFGDYVLEVTIDRKAADYIDNWYDTHSVFTPESILELEKVLKIKGAYKLKISRNKSKAERYRAIFRKYFVMK